MELMAFEWRNYRCDDAYDELFEPSGAPRPAARQLLSYLQELPAKDLADRRLAADLAIKVMGITFTVYSEGKTLDRAWPFDMIPRCRVRSVSRAPNAVPSNATADGARIGHQLATKFAVLFKLEEKKASGS